MGTDVIFDWESAVKAGMETYTREIYVIDDYDTPITETVTFGIIANLSVRYGGNKSTLSARPDVLDWLNAAKIPYYEISY